MPSPVNIVCGADERFALPLAIVLRSAAMHCSRPVEAFILNNDLTAASKRRVENVCARMKQGPRLYWLDVDPAFMAKTPVVRPHLSKAAFLRLAMGRLLPSDLDRAIYLDSDVLVVQDLVPLWETDLDGNVVGAVRDFMTPLIGQPDALDFCVPAMGLDPTAPMFNSGVLLIDIKRFLDEGVETACIQYFDRWREQRRYADQGALNIVLARRWNRLPFRWNLQVTAWRHFQQHPSLSPDELAEIRATDPAILHFSGAMKPWNSGLRWQECRQYVQNVRDSGWYSPAEFIIWNARRTTMCIRNGIVNRIADRKRPPNQFTRTSGGPGKIAVR